MSMSIHLDVQGIDPDRCRTVPHGKPFSFTTVELAADGVALVLYVGREDVAGARALAGMLLAAADEVEAGTTQRVTA